MGRLTKAEIAYMNALEERFPNTQQFFDRDGAQIKSGDWTDRFGTDYQRVRGTFVFSDGKLEHFQTIKPPLVSAAAEVSTVWLGLDHGWGSSEKPVIFETMVFGKDLDPLLCDSQERYTSEESAIAGHERWVKRIQAALMRGSQTH